MRLEGVFHVLATPFRADGELDRDGLRALVREVLAAGVDGLTILGVMGEAHKLSASERSAVISIVFAAVDGRIPVVVGASRDGTATAVEASEEAAAGGAAAVMVAPPTFIAPGPALTAHFKGIESVGLPIVLQDFPPINGVKLSAAQICDLIAAVPAIACVKLEDPPTPRRSSQVLANADRDVTVLGGLSALYLLEELRHGTHGTMTGFPFSRCLVEIWKLWTESEESRAEEVYRRWLPLFVADSQPLIGVALRKRMWLEQGVIGDAGVRGPSTDLTPLEIAGLKMTLKAIGPEP